MTNLGFWVLVAAAVWLLYKNGKLDLKRPEQRVRSFISVHPLISVCVGFAVLMSVLNGVDFMGACWGVFWAFIIALVVKFAFRIVLNIDLEPKQAQNQQENAS